MISKVTSSSFLSCFERRSLTPKSMFLFLIYSLLFTSPFFISAGLSLENGLARTPPMGWLSWQTFWCQVDCKNHPRKCVSENQITAMVDRIVEDGYRDAGYEFVIVDDCWLAHERDAEGKLQPDPQRFSKGIKWLADYVHDRKLKFGIYEDYGNKTCAGYPGSMGHVETDARTFASWGVDYLKLDVCFASASDLNEGNPEFRKALNETGRPIVFSTAWPLGTQILEHKMPNYSLVRENCNLWRNYHDIEMSWSSILRIIDYYDSNQDELIQAAGPGGWHDPDSLIIGNPCITVDQSKVQMAIWSIWSAPLVMSVDMREIREPFKKILQNRAVISINQDPLGIMGRLVVKTGSISVYVKPVTPVDQTTGDHSYAIAFMNRAIFHKANVTVQHLVQLGLRRAQGYVLENLFDNDVIITIGPKDSFSTIVYPTGVTMYKATIVQ